jgi:CheY-like chemotaxis protein
MTVSAKSNGRVILCVDDETTGLSVRKTLLESQGYRVLTAENGPDALVLFSSEDPELVILDYSMPGMNGDIVAERMKELRSDLPIIMLSA